MLVEHATEADGEWVRRLFARNAGELGLYANTVWHQFWQGRRDGRLNEFILVIRPDLAFVHFRHRIRDGLKVIYELAVEDRARRSGLGSALLAAVGRPSSTRCNATNEAGNSFLLARGFLPNGVTFTKDGRAMNGYLRL